MAISITKNCTFTPNGLPSSGPAPSTWANEGVTGSGGDATLSVHANAPSSNVVTGINGAPALDEGPWYEYTYPVVSLPFHWMVADVDGSMDDAGLEYAMFDTSWQFTFTVFDNELDGTSTCYTTPGNWYIARGVGGTTEVQTAGTPWLMGRFCGGARTFGISNHPQRQFLSQADTDTGALNGVMRINHHVETQPTSAPPLITHAFGSWAITADGGDTASDIYDAIAEELDNTLGPIFNGDLAGITGNSGHSKAYTIAIRGA